MALRPDRNYVEGTDISYFMNSAMERGGVVVFNNSGSGAAMDQSAANVRPSGSLSGTVPVGLLLNDMVNLDLTRQHLNQHKDEVQLGGKVAILRQGQVTTNVLDTGIHKNSISAGSGAYYVNHTFGGIANTYVLTATSGAGWGGLNAAPRVGTFLSRVDEDGYAKVEIDMGAINYEHRADA